MNLVRCSLTFVLILLMHNCLSIRCHDVIMHMLTHLTIVLCIIAQRNEGICGKLLKKRVAKAYGSHHSVDWTFIKVDKC